MSYTRIEVIINFSLLLLLLLPVLESGKASRLYLEQDCNNNNNQDQYYSNEECKNCSDIVALFSSTSNSILRRGDWLNKEISDENNNVDIIRNTNNQNNRVGNDAVLSRLIGIDQSHDADGSLDETSSYNANGQNSGDQSTTYSTSDITGEDFNDNGKARESATIFQLFVDRFVRSKLVENELPGTIRQCKYKQNVTACQMWSNFCVMSMYSYSDNGFNSKSLKALARNRQNVNKQTFTKRSWQDCEEFSGSDDFICNGFRDWFRNEKKVNMELQSIYAQIDTDLDQELGSKKLSNSNLLFKLNQPIQMLVYRYAMNGRSLGVDQFGLNELEQFCIITDNKRIRLYSAEENFVRVGRNRQLKGCKFNSFQAYLANYQNQRADRYLFNQTIFMDLYLGYSLPNAGGLFIKPIPILIKNLRYNGIQVNRKYQKDASRWKLVHRFFTQSVVSLDSSLTSSSRAHKNNRNHYHQQEDSSELAPTRKDETEMESTTTSTVKEGNKLSNIQRDELFLLFAEDVSLELKFKRYDKNARLVSIQLTIDYNIINLNSDLNKNDMNVSNSSIGSSSNSSNARGSTHRVGTFSEEAVNNVILGTKVTITQTLLDMQRLKSDLDLTITILSILSSIWSLIKCYNQQKYYGLVKLDLRSLLRFLIIACDTMANLFMLIIFIFLNYLFMTLKFQSSVQLLYPSEELEGALITNFKIAFVFKLIGFAHRLHTYLNFDIFFIDWEKPKMLTSSQVLNYTTYMIGKGQQQQDNNTNKLTSTIDTNPDITSLDRSQAFNQSTSFWRPYTVINRWLHMQTYRRQNLELQLILFVCIIELANLNQLGDSNSFAYWWFHWSIPRADHYRDGSRFKLLPHEGWIFRAFLLSLVYLTISCGQILFKKYFHEPMIRNSIAEFVDLCSVANISLFAMMYPRFGYYVHGRNANGSSDCGIAEMSALLEREERDLCTNRGLSANSDQQTFVLTLPKIVNDHYRKLLLKENLMSGFINQRSEQQMLGKQQHLGSSILKSALNLAQGPSFGTNRVYIETIAAKNKAINAFLTNFLEHIYKDIDYSIKEQRRFEGFLLDFDLFGNGEGDDDDYTNNQRAASASVISRNNNQLSANNAANLSGSNGQQVSSSSSTPLNNIGITTKLNGAATFYNDHSNSFGNLLWLGLEFELILLELLSLLLLDYTLGSGSSDPTINADFNMKPLPIIITLSLVWILHLLFRAFYIVCARNNLVNKALVDEKFLLR